MEKICEICSKKTDMWWFADNSICRCNSCFAKGKLKKEKNCDFCGSPSHNWYFADLLNKKNACLSCFNLILKKRNSVLILANNLVIK